ncbi:MAG: ECF-type sigma factor [Planctomycetota bacterium]
MSNVVCATTQMMRRILIDHARARRSEKRGGGQAHETLTELVSIVELRFFGGLTIEEIAEVKSSSPSTIKRQWRFARAKLFDKF